MRPSAVAYLTSSPHIFIPRNGRIVREDHAPVSQSDSLLPEPFWPSRLRLHHYAVQSREDFEIKQARGVANPSHPRDVEYYHIHDRNDVEDVTALQFVPAIRGFQARRRAPGRGWRFWRRR